MAKVIQPLKNKPRSNAKSLGGHPAINLLIFFVALIIAVCLSEVILRFLFPYTTTSAAGYRIPDRKLGWRLKPGAQVELVNPEYRVSVMINSHGWRDAEHSYTKPKGVFRIVVLGDSFMEAYSVELEESFCRQLEKNFETSMAVEVINLGVGGYGTLQEYLSFLEEGKKYAPDLVLLAFLPANDVRDNSRTLQSAFYRSKADHYKIISRPFLKPGANDDWTILFPDIERAVALAEQGKRPRPWWKETFLYAFCSSSVKRLHQNAEGLNSSTSAFDPLIWLGAYMCDESEEYAEAWRITERIIVRLNHTVEQTGAKLIMFTVPSMLDAYDAFIRSVLEAVEKPESFCFDRSPAINRILDIFRRNKIPYVDLLPAFQKASRNDKLNLFYSKQDGHWNATGHALAAKIVYEELLQSDYLTRH